MQFKKGWFSYFNQAIGTALLSVYLYTLFVSFIDRYDFDALVKLRITGIPFSIVVIVCFYILIIGIFLIFSFLKTHIIKNQKKIVDVIHGCIGDLCVLASLFYGVYLRLNYIWAHYNDSSVFGINEWNRINSYFNQNFVSFDNYIEHLYSYIVIFFLKVFGFKSHVVLYINMVLFLLAAVLLMLTIRWLFGNAASVFSFAFMIFSSMSMDLMDDLSGNNLWIFFVALLFMNAAFFLEIVVKNYPVTSLLTLIALVFLALALNVLLFKPYELLFIFNEKIITNCLSFYPVANIVLLIFGIWGFMSLIFVKKDSISALNILLIIVLILTGFDYSSNCNFVFFVMAIGAICGYGFYSFFCDGYKTILVVDDTVKDDDRIIKLDEVAEDIPTPVVANIAEEILVPVEANKVEEVLVPVEANDVEEVQVPVEANNIEEDQMILDADETELVSATEVVENVEEQERVNASVSVKFIDNPLPLPKKHVKKTMEFPYDFDDSSLKFDYELKSTDDFDI